MKEFLDTRLKHTNVLRDKKRETAFEDEINTERHNMEYFPSYEDIIDLFTIATVSEKKVVSAFGGGI